MRSAIDIFIFRQGEYWEDHGEGSIDSNIDKVFAALRRFVNDEINETIFAVRLAEVVLKSGIIQIETLSHFRCAKDCPILILNNFPNTPPIIYPV